MGWLSAADRFRRLEAPRVLVVRNDGLGDLVLTLPLLAALKQARPDCHLTLLLAAPFAPLAPLLVDVDAVIPDEGVLLKRHRERFAPAERARRRAALEEQVRAGAFDVALLPYAEAGSARLVHRARIPLRVGPLRRTFCWRFNAYYRRTRKGSTDAEYALNLGYLACLGLPAAYAAPRLHVPDAALPAEPDGQPYVVLHPHKRSGTALTWPLERFVALAQGLAARGLRVRVVGDPPDRPVLEPAFAALPHTTVETTHTLPQLLGVLAGARLFVGNSSGPLHLAALAGRPHVALFPQDRVSAPERWRTLPVPGAPPDFRRYLLASRFPKDCVVCEGAACPHYNCVASLGEDAVWDAIAAWRVPGLGAG